MKYIIPTLESDRLILKKGSYEDYVQVYEYDFTRLRNINGEFEYVKYDPEKLKGFEKYADEEENVLDFIIFLKDNNQLEILYMIDIVKIISHWKYLLTYIQVIGIKDI